MNEKAKGLVLLLLGAVLWSCSGTQNGNNERKIDYPKANSPLTFMFYNVENLFDTLDTEYKADESFLPNGENRWNSYRYFKKLKSTAKVIGNIGGWEAPVFIGFCEVETEGTLHDLIGYTSLKKLGYKVGPYHESGDHRGIDVAFIYRPEYFKPLELKPIVLEFPNSGNYTSRDILQVKGELLGQEVFVFLNHWPSRRGGQTASEPKRIVAARALRKAVDDILADEPEAQIIITGDFNDGPENTSVAEILGATHGVNETDLFNLSHQLKFKKGLGTHRYRGEWNCLDQWIVSNSLFDTSRFISTTVASAKIYNEDWLKEKDPHNPGKKPFRTYAGPRYLGGFSDHLPIYLTLHVNPKGK